jgi:hypothetical protein
MTGARTGRRIKASIITGRIPEQNEYKQVGTFCSGCQP